MMRVARFVALLSLVCMGTVLIYAFANGNFSEEGRLLLSMPWGIVSLVDLYVGFILFSGWIVYREQSLSRSIVWVISVMLLGFFAASLYALVALLTSGGNWKRFWMGRSE